MSAFVGFIDPPGAFSDAAEWLAFVVELEQMTPSPEVDAAIADARRHMRGRVEQPPTRDPEEEEDDFSDLEEGDGGGEED